METSAIRDRELREILDRILEKIRARGENGSGGENHPPGSLEDPRSEREETMGQRVDVYRFGQVVGRFRCPEYEPYSLRDAVCRHFMSSCECNPGYKSTDGILCYPASPRNDEVLEALKGTLGDEVVSE